MVCVPTAVKKGKGDLADIAGAGAGGIVFQLMTCGDSAADQRKAFITLLQSVPS
ncbi:MAG: hypothetical protein ACSLEN_05450 [Candidatus Malihini olakiniferum]